MLVGRERGGREAVQLVAAILRSPSPRPAILELTLTIVGQGGELPSTVYGEDAVKGARKLRS